MVEWKVYTEYELFTTYRSRVRKSHTHTATLFMFVWLGVRACYVRVLCRLSKWLKYAVTIFKMADVGHLEILGVQQWGLLAHCDIFDYCAYSH